MTGVEGGPSMIVARAPAGPSMSTVLDTVSAVEASE